MKITDLYRIRRFPWITLAVIVCCIIVTSIAAILPESYNSLALSNQPQYVWQYVSGVFLHGTGGDTAMALMHLTANIMMFAPYGIMIEKLIGHKKYGVLFLASWLGVSAVFQIIAGIVANGETAYGAGLSGSSYAVIAMGVYILFRLSQKSGSCFFRQPLAYVFISGLVGELFMLLPFVAGAASTVLHLAGIAIGVVMTMIFNKSIMEKLS